jgi:hypothetical protein
MTNTISVPEVGVQQNNDGGAVITIFLMVAAITYAMYTSITVYVNDDAPVRNKEDKDNNGDDADASSNKQQTIVRILSGWANIGNSITHLLLMIYTISNNNNQSIYWEKEREIGGIEGPIFLALLNGIIGLISLYKWSFKIPLIWNAFIIFSGTLLPIVWARFLEEGLTTWPYIILFIWFMIFAMELTAFTSSLTYYLMVSRRVDTTHNKKDE